MLTVSTYRGEPMKKCRIIAFVLAFSMLLLLTACADTGTADRKKNRDKSDAISIEEVNILRDTAEFSLVYLYTGDKVIPPKPNGAYTYSEADEGMTYLVLVIDVKNLGEETVEVGDLMEVTLTLEGQEITAGARVETDHGTSLDRYSEIAPLVTARVHYLFEIPDNQQPETLSLRVKAGDRRMMSEISVEELKNRSRALALGDIITDEQTIEAAVEDVFLTTKLEPENPGRYYHYFEADSGKTYLVMKLTVKNLDSSELDYDTIAGIKCIYDGKYEYSGFTVFEEDGGADLSSYTNISSMAPLEENGIYFLVEIPDEAAAGPLTMELYLAGQYCHYHVE